MLMEIMSWSLTSSLLDKALPSCALGSCYNPPAVTVQALLAPYMFSIELCTSQDVSLPSPWISNIQLHISSQAPCHLVSCDWLTVAHF